MIDNSDGIIAIHCDRCSEYYDPSGDDPPFESETDDWNAVWTRARQLGWRAVKLGPVFS